MAHYPFDEGSGTAVRDVSGNGNHGVLHGARYVAVEKGYALEFDGDADRVEIPASESLKLPDVVAVEVWINTKFPITGGVISKNGCMLLRQNYALQLQEGRDLVSARRVPGVRKGCGRGARQPEHVASHRRNVRRRRGQDLHGRPPDSCHEVLRFLHRNV